MDDAARMRLEKKKKNMQAQLQVTKQSEHLANWWLPFVTDLQDAGIPWQIAYLAAAPGETYLPWCRELQRPPWSGMKFSDDVILDRESSPVHDQLFNTFPTTNPLRYLPPIPVLGSQEGLANSFSSLLPKAIHMYRQPVYFVFARMSPVIRINVSHFLEMAAKQLLPEGEDICIIPANFEWLLFRSLEDEWRFTG